MDGVELPVALCRSRSTAADSFGRSLAIVVRRVGRSSRKIPLKFRCVVARASTARADEQPRGADAQASPAAQSAGSDAKSLRDLLRYEKRASV